MVPTVGPRRRVLAVLATVLTAIIALSSIAADGGRQPEILIAGQAEVTLSAPAWDSVFYTASETENALFELRSGDGVNQRLKVLDPIDGSLLGESELFQNPARVTVPVTNGSSYIVTWLVNGPTEYTISATPPSRKGLVIMRGRLDSTRRTAPEFLERDFVSGVSDSVSFGVSWDGSSVISMAVYDPETKADVAKKHSQPGGSLELSALLSANHGYKLRIWSDDGAANISITAANHKRHVEPPRDAPNILIINVDDARVDSMNVLPAVRKWFGEEGTLFTNAFVSTPSCCPSRATLMSGQNAHNHGVIGQNVPALNQSNTIQRYLSESGYLTGHSGKFLHYFNLDQRGPFWDRWNYLEGGYYGLFVNRDGVVVDDSEYSTTLIFDRAIEFAEDFESFSEDTPWFLHVTPTAPHRPSQPEPRFEQAEIPERPHTPSLFESDKSDKPPYVQQPISYGPEDAAAERARMLRTLMSLDVQVDRLMNRLQEMGELENTIAIFTSDNGVMLGEHGLEEKFVPYREAVEVPFYVRWPGVVAEGASDSRIVGNLDIAPTVLTAAGVAPKHVIDGIDILSGAARRYRYTEYFADPVNGARWPTWSSISDTRFVYTEYYDEAGLVTFTEYYDLVEDPFELLNLYADGNEDNNPRRTDLSNLLEVYRFCGGSSCSPQS